MKETLFNRVYEQDCRQGLQRLPDQSIHCILTDIPYGIGAEEWDVLHDNTNSAYMGQSPAQARAGTVFKKRGKPLNGWAGSDRTISRQYQDWCMEWAGEWLRVLKPGGQALVFAGRRMCHRCIAALEDTGLIFKDMLAWMRARAPHRAQRLSEVYRRRGDTANAKAWHGWRIGNLRPTFEPVLWFVKPYAIGATLADTVIRHGVGAYNQTAFSRYENNPDNVLTGNFRKGEKKSHPTQKPLAVLKELIELTTCPDHIVLDPFCGSGSTLVAAKELQRNYIGFETDPGYAALSRKRLGLA